MAQLGGGAGGDEALNSARREGSVGTMRKPLPAMAICRAASFLWIIRPVPSSRMDASGLASSMASVLRARFSARPRV